MKRVFENDGRSWSAIYAADKWLREQGYSMGPVGNLNPKAGIMRGGGTCVPSLDCMSVEEIRGLHGTITPMGGFKSGSAIVEIRDEFAPKEEAIADIQHCANEAKASSAG